MAATMQDVAAHAGVSLKTVSRVVNDLPNIRSQTRARVLAAIEELGYQPNSAARTLRTGRTDVIGLGLPELEQPFFATLAEAVLREAELLGLTVLIEPTGSVREMELSLLRDQAGTMDGLILYPVTLTDTDGPLLGRTIPTVFLREHAFAWGGDQLAMANVEAIDAAVDHLVAIGRRRIAVLGADLAGVSPAGTARTAGFLTAMAARGLEVPGELLVDVGDCWHRAEGLAGMRRVIDTGRPVDAVLAFNDALALGALRGAWERGLRVPDDIAVMGFDDTDEARYSIPTLTSVAPGIPELARRAVALLAARIAGREPSELGERAPQFALQVRESTLGVGAS